MYTELRHRRFYQHQHHYLDVWVNSLRAGYYMYTEGTGVHIGTSAVLVSPTLNWNSALTCVTFWYSMEGSQIGSLDFGTAPGRGGGWSRTTVLWSRAGSQGDGWKKASVTVHTSSPVKVLW